MTLAERVLHVLAIAEGPWTIDDLRTGLDVSRRDIESSLEELRLAGNAIIAGNGGVRLTVDPGELERYIDARRRRLVTIYAGNRSLRKTLRAMETRNDLTLFPGSIA